MIRRMDDKIASVQDLNYFKQKYLDEINDYKYVIQVCLYPEDFFS